MNTTRKIAALSLVIGALFQVTMAWASFTESFANNVKYVLLPRLFSPGFLLILVVLIVLVVVLRMRKKR